MATCGYICPQCEGKEYLDDGSVCDWCISEKANSEEESKET